MTMDTFNSRRKIGWLIGVVATVFLISVSSACLANSESSNMEPSIQQRAEISITTTIYPGNTEYFVEFYNNQPKVSSTVKYYYNPVTKEESFQGNLSPVYQAIVGQPPDDPSAFQTPDSILTLLNTHGWTIIDDKTVKDPHSYASKSEIRTIKLQRLNH